MYKYLNRKDNVSLLLSFADRRLVYDSLKRAFDVVLSIIGIVVTFPVVAVAAVLIMLDSEGGWLYSQQRVGQNRKVFTIYKLRTMYVRNDERWTEKDDPRITTVGKFLRMARIDEIPQLINVVRGEMSLIGPRPERPVYEAMIVQELCDFRERLKVKPGITGWAQVNGGYNLSHYEKLELDLYYIKNRCLLLDAKILFLTLIVIFTAKGAR